MASSSSSSSITIPPALNALVVRKRRRSSTSPSSFVRLHPQRAQNLWQQAVRCEVAVPSPAHGPSESHQTHSSWTVTQQTTTAAASTQVASGIEFLPLEIQLPRNQEHSHSDTTSTTTTLYASYNGGDYMEEENAIEVPEEFVDAMNDDDTALVTVRVLPVVPYSAQVTMEAVSVQDWNRIQPYTDWLEEGGFLNQVSLVYVGQRLRLWLPSSTANDGSPTVVNLRVVWVEKDPPSPSIWPSTTEETFNQLPSHEKTSLPCRCIRADTEIVLLPSDTQSTTGADNSAPVYKLLPAKEEYSLSMQQIQEHLSRTTFPSPLVSCPFGTVVLHPDDWSTETPFLRIHPARNEVHESHHEYSAFSEGYLVHVTASEFVKKGHIVVHPLIRLALGMSLYYGKVRIERISRLEWDQATTTQNSVGDDAVTLRPLRLLRSHGSFRRPLVVNPIHTFPCEQMLAQSGDLVPHDGIVAFPTGNDWEDVKLFKVVAKSESNLPDSPRTNRLFGVNELQHLRTVTKYSTIDDAYEQVFVHETLNELPPVSVFPKALRDLESAIEQDESFVLLGKNGSGKTHSALILATMSHFLSGRRVMYLDCRAAKSIGRIVGIMDAIQDAVQDARDHNALLILDDLDELVSESHVAFSQGSGAQVQQPNWTEIEQSKLISDHIRQLLDHETDRPPVIVTCNTADIAHSVFPSDTFPILVHLPVLDCAEKLDMMVQFLEWGSRGQRTCKIEQIRHGCTLLDFEGTSRSFLPFDLYTFSSRLQRRLNRIASEDPDSVQQVLQEEICAFVPISRDAASLENVESTATWDEVGGLYEAKQELLDTIVRPSLYRRIYENSSVRLPRGILLYGPTGCGKSHLVPALASHSNLPLVMCRGPELLDRYIGGSEAKVRDLFSRAFLAAPCILFLDEFDALAPKRGSDSTGVTDRVVNQLLTFLDGVEDMSASNTVYIIAATSRPDKIDPALLRPGRLEKHVYIGLPENQQEMIDIIQKMARRYAVQQDVLATFCASYDYANTAALSPADVRAAFQTAHILALRLALRENTSATTTTTNSVCIEESHLRQGFSQVRRSLTTQDIRYYTNMRDRFQKKHSANTGHDTTDETTEVVPLRTALK